MFSPSIYAIERALALRINGDDDAALFALKLNVINIANSEAGQQSLHYNTGEVRSSHNSQLANGCIESRWQFTKDPFSQKRFSLNLEGPSEHFPFVLSDCQEYRGNASLYSKHLGDNDVSGGKHRKKRRISNLGCLTSSFFEDYAKAARRGSMASASSFAASNRGSSKCDSDDDDSVLSQMSDGVVFDLVNASRFQIHSRSNLTEINLKEKMEMFFDAMSMSQKSQHAIHDWDKKMGLKRSHSKTMRLSMRSRKKLKTLIKKDMLLLSNNR